MATSPSRVDRVVRRELCALISKGKWTHNTLTIILYGIPGTRMIGFFQGEEPETESAYLLAIKEKVCYN